MEAIIKYKANDGSEWNSAEKATERDNLILTVDGIMSALNPVPDDTNFSNGHGYIQQDAKALANVKADLFHVANTEGILKWWVDSQKKDHGKTEQDLIENCHPSWFSRMLDGGHRPLDRAYNRLYCIDEQNREWGQPYYALNPTEGDQVEYESK